MKKFNYLLLGILAVFSLTAGIMYHSGSPGQKSGSPGDGGSTCVQCHGGNAVTQVSGWISTDIPVNGYTPGTTYNITLSAHHAGAALYGFEMTSEDNSDNKQGSFIVTNSTTTQLVFGSSNAISHTGAGITPSNDSINWSFQWTAPVTGTGDITFYSAINAANGNGGTSGDNIYTSTLTVGEEIVTGIEDELTASVQVYPNPTSSLLQITGLDESVSMVSLVNQLGQAVRELEVSTSELIMNVEDLEKGIYYVKFNALSKIKSQMVLIK